MIPSVGDLLVYCWGYDQTNIDWYEVVAVRGKRLSIRPIAARIEPYSPSAMSGRSIPVRGEFTGPAVVKVWRDDERQSAKMPYGVLKIETRPHRDCSWYA